MPEIQVRKDLADKAKALDINVDKLIHDKLDPAPDPANPWKGATLLLCLVGFLLLIAGFNRPAPEPDRKLASSNERLITNNQKLSDTIGRLQATNKRIYENNLRLTAEKKQLAGDFQALSGGSSEGISEVWAKRIYRDVIAKGLVDVQRGQWGMTVLIDAIKSGDTERVKWFLENGADPNVASFAMNDGKVDPKTIGKTPLMWAITFGRDDIIRILINDPRTDLLVVNQWRLTALKMLHKQIEQQPARAKKLREHIAAMGL